MNLSISRFSRDLNFKFQASLVSSYSTYIMNTHQGSEEIFEVSSAAYISIYLADICYLINILEIDFLLSFFMLCFQDGFIFMLVDERSRWRHIKKYYLILNLKIECPLVLDFNYSVGVISKNKKFKGKVGFLFHVFKLFFSSCWWGNMKVDNVIGSSLKKKPGFENILGLIFTFGKTFR